MLNILTTAPINGANSGESGICKTTTIGGVPRAYLSSQSMLRPVRMALHSSDPSRYGGIRTKYMGELIEPELKKLGCPDEQLKKLVAEFNSAMISGKSAKKAEADKKKKDAEKKKKDDDKSESKDSEVTEDGSVLAFFSKGEIAGIAEAIKNNGWVMTESVILDAIKTRKAIDIVDIALFGRMFTMSPDVNISGAVCVSNAYSTHKAANDIDYFTAIDDLRKSNTSSHIATREFASATYACTVIINIDQLRSNLPNASKDEIQQICLDVCQSVLQNGFPEARRTRTLSNVYPNYVLATVYNGCPCAASFETPVQPSFDGGYLVNSIDALNKEVKRILSFADATVKPTVVVDDTGLNITSLKKVINNV